MRSTQAACRSSPSFRESFAWAATAEAKRFILTMVKVALRGPRTDEERVRYTDSLGTMFGTRLDRLILAIFALITIPIVLPVHFVLNLHKLPAWLRCLHSTGVVAASPPMVADYVLSLFLSRRNKSETIGDLTEEFHEEIAPAFGFKAARFWYWKKTISAIVERNPIVRKFLIGGGVLKAGEMIWKLFAG